MGLSAVMDIARDALNTYRVAQEVTGENIANVNTPGYSRQRVLLETAPPNSTSGFIIGTGVNIARVERYYDSMLQQQLVSAQTSQGYDTTQSSVLQQVEQIFNQISSDGLGSAISDYFGAWQDLSLNPDGSAERQVVLSRGQILADNFHAVSANISDTISSLNDSLVSLTDNINATLKNIADLNGQIKITEQLGGNTNAIRDQRDQQIRDLSGKIGITYTENADGTTDVNYADGGATLVKGSLAGAFSLTNPGGTHGVELTPASPPGGAAAPVTPTTGQLGAAMTLRDTTIPSYLNELNTLASTIITKVNDIHKGGYQHDGITTNVAFFNGTTAADIALNITTTSEIAASGVSGVVGDNSNALKMAQLQNAPTMGTLTFNSYQTGLISRIGLDVQASKNAETRDAAFTTQLSTLRESNSGVSLDEELTNLVKYQRSYQASAKLVTTATDMMDIVLGLVR